ncbi:MAG TPA: SbcC/MukB-like Walker B domain-containing protein, partial [Candidatus Thermoplasmatota archaeon]|nr:SbcC/MukB-like Walker B domain-containing protein [Candidatus Thermoplasmatota archaeon]
RESALRARLEKLAADESRAAAGAARLAEAQARAARLRGQEAALAGAPFDAKELDAAKVHLRALEAVRDRHARLVADAEREPELVVLIEELARGEALAREARGLVQARRESLAFDAAAHEALEARAHATEARLHDARIRRERAVGERMRREDEEARLATTLAQQRALAERAAGIEARVRLLEELAGERDAGLLPAFKDHLISRIRPLLSLHAGRLFRELTEGRYADLEVDADYDILVHDDGKPFALARFSGGEGDLANLCLRLAVSQVVAERAGTEGFGFLALDEIFGSQDEVRKGNILRALAGLSGRFRQILLITHIADVKDSADHVLRVEALDDGTSQIVVEG